MERVDNILERLIPRLRADTAPGILRDFSCPICGIAGGYDTFFDAANGTGLKCQACGCTHPFGEYWLLSAITDTGDQTIYRQNITIGNWVAEPESAAAFDLRVEKTGLFNIYREVRGFYVQPRLGQPPQTARIDRILSPTQALLEQGWLHGPIGVDCKASGLKAGQAISQLLDYNRVVWHLSNGFCIWLNWIFLWPLDKQSNAVASVMAQNRIGSASYSRWHLLELYSGGQSILRVGMDGEVAIGNGLNGLKIGSRSGRKI